MRIAREGKARCPAAQADGFIDYLHRTGVADTRDAPGCEGIHVYRRALEGEQTEIVLVTFWQSRDHARGYSGPVLERAVLYPEDAIYHLDPDEHVTIYDVATIEGQHG